MEPLNHLMSVTQSQNLQRTEPNANQRQVQQQNLVVEQQHKVQETVTSIPKEANDSDEMMAFRNGMGGRGGMPDSQKQPPQPENDLPEKGLLKEGSGQNLDIIG